MLNTWSVWFMITVIYDMLGLEYGKTYVVNVFWSILWSFIALYESIAYIIGKCDILVNRKPCAFIWMYAKAFMWFDGDMLCAIHYSGGPHGWPVEAAWLTSLLPHIRRRVESLNGMNVNWDTRGHHTGFSGANAKVGYLVCVWYTKN